MATPARTVNKSLGKSFKNTLDLPFKLKWPAIPQETATELFSELTRALNGVKFTSTNKKLRRGKKRKTEGEEDVGRQPKRQRVDEGGEGTALTEQELLALPEQGTSSANPPSPPPPPPEELVAKRSQIVVGVNEVTRGLERNNLRAAVVCLSVRSPLLHDHLQVLSATRNVPCIALNGVSAAVAPVLGLKRAMTIGLKVSNCFVCVQWNTSNQDANGTEESGYNSGVSLLN
ncbi:Ribonuclease P protein subunit p38 [Geodia barretti]|uniref:Ribonuclease P protein subunit p38 n=1 Tax=Geodia barretti TaxID=519541 RepID=A0AA35RBI7_GEOBA|nr:Ribonuclease P protein subunit p38 [Geodia barretti]